MLVAFLCAEMKPASSSSPTLYTPKVAPPCRAVVPDMSRSSGGAYRLIGQVQRDRLGWKLDRKMSGESCSRPAHVRVPSALRWTIRVWGGSEESEQRGTSG